jgi:hypothetical protein
VRAAMTLSQAFASKRYWRLSMADRLQVCSRAPAPVRRVRLSSSDRYCLTISKSCGSRRDSVAALNRSAASLGFEKLAIGHLPLNIESQLY